VDTNEDPSGNQDRSSGPKLRNKAANRMFLAQTQTPAIAPLPAVKEKQPTDSGDLFSYLTAMLMFQISTGQSQTNISKMNLNMSETSMNLLKAALDKATSSQNTSADQDSSAHKTSFWSSLLSMVGVAVGSVVFLMTGSPLLLIMSIVSMVTSTVQTSDGKSLDEGLSDAVGNGALSFATELCGGNPPPALVAALKDVFLAAITIAETAILGGGEKLLQSGSQEAEQVASAIASDGAAVGEDVANSAAKVAPSVTREWAGKLLITMAYNGSLLNSVCQQMATALFPNDEEGRAIFAAVLQFALSAAAGAAGAKMNISAGSLSLTKLLSGKMGESAFLWTTRIAKGAQLAINASAAGCEVSTGVVLQQEAATLKDQGQARSSIAITQRIVDVLRTASTATNKTFNTVNQSINEMISSAERRLEALDPQNYQAK